MTTAPCPREEVYLKYEMTRVPADVEPTFVYIGACPLAAPGS
jgi:hypothetical protein